jgi:hypothetical protein
MLHCSRCKRRPLPQASVMLLTSLANHLKAGKHLHEVHKSVQQLYMMNYVTDKYCQARER